MYRQKWTSLGRSCCISEFSSSHTGTVYSQKPVWDQRPNAQARGQPWLKTRLAASHFLSHRKIIVLSSHLHLHGLLKPFKTQDLGSSSCYQARRVWLMFCWQRTKSAQCTEKMCRQRTITDIPGLPNSFQVQSSYSPCHCFPAEQTLCFLKNWKGEKHSRRKFAGIVSALHFLSILLPIFLHNREELSPCFQYISDFKEDNH